MPEGTIKKIVADRGFGFIASEGGKEYFFHRSGVGHLDSLRERGPGEPLGLRSDRAPSCCARRRTEAWSSTRGGLAPSGCSIGRRGSWARSTMTPTSSRDIPF